MSFSVFANNALNAINNILYSRIYVTAKHAIFEDHSITPAVYELKKKYVFVLFYKLSCSHCRKFDPILKNFSDVTGIKVKAFTLDGGVLPSFPDVQNLNRNIIEEYFGAKAHVSVPTLFIMNTQNSHVFPVAIGELSYQELAERMNNVVNKLS